MSENIPEWITKLALDIYKVLQQYKAMPRFHEMINKWAKNQEAEIDKLRTWNEKRRLHFEQTVTCNPCLQDEKTGPPEQGWQFENHIQHIMKNTESGIQRSYNIIKGWVPLELSNSKRPKITQLFPLRREYKLTLIEKYTILAAIYDYGRKGTEEVPPWKWPDFNLDVSSEALSDAKKCLFFECLCHSISELNPNVEGWLRAILDDVRKDVSNWTSVELSQLKKENQKVSSETRTDKCINKIKNHPVISIIIIIGIIIIAFGTVMEKFDSIVTFCCRVAGQQKKNQTPAEKNLLDSNERTPSTKNAILDYNNWETPLQTRTKKRIDDICKKIEIEKLNPWLSTGSGSKLQITKYNGKVISPPEGIRFEGSPRVLFWSDDFIPPFIEDGIIKVFDQTIEECR
jgi:hypothetical protein